MTFSTTASTIKPSALGIGAIAVLLWGATPAATEFAVAEIDPVLAGMARTILAAPLLILLIPLTRVRMPSGWGDWALASIAALGGFVGFNLLFSLGVAQTSTAHAALIIASPPIVTGFIGFAIARDWPRPVWWAGAAIAFLGEAVLVFGDHAVSGQATVVGDVLCVAAVICVAIGYVAGGKLSARIGSWSAMTWSILLATLVLLPFAGPGVMTASFDMVSVQAWSSIAFLAVGASVLGYAAWYWALDKGGVKRIAPLQFAQPLVSLVIAVAVLSETLHAPVLIAALLILFGVALTRRA